MDTFNENPKQEECLMNENKEDHKEIDNNIKDIKSASITILKDKVETDCYINNCSSSFVEYERKKSEQIERLSKLKLENTELNANLQQEVSNRENLKLDADSIKIKIKKHAYQLNLLKNRIQQITLHKIKMAEWLKSFNQVPQYQEEENQKQRAYVEQMKQVEILINKDEEYFTKLTEDLKEILDQHKEKYCSLEDYERELIKEIEMIDIDSHKIKYEEELSHKAEVTKDLNKLQESFTLAVTNCETEESNFQIEISNLESFISANTEAQKELKCCLEVLYKENEENNKLIPELSSEAKILEDELFDQEESIANLNQVKLEQELKLADHRIGSNKNVEDFNVQLESLKYNLKEIEEYNENFKQEQVNEEEKIRVLNEEKNKILEETEILQNKIEFMKANVSSEELELRNLIDEYNNKINTVSKNNDEQQKRNENFATEVEEKKQNISDFISKIEQKILESKNIMEKRNKVAETTKEEIKLLLIQLEKIDEQDNQLQISFENEKKELDTQAEEKINKAVAARNEYQEKVNIVLRQDEEKYANEISKHEDEQKRYELQISELKASIDNLEKELTQTNQEIYKCTNIIQKQSDTKKVEENQSLKKLPEKRSNLKKNPKDKKIPPSSQITVSAKAAKTETNMNISQKPTEPVKYSSINVSQKLTQPANSSMAKPTEPISSTKKRVLSLWDTEDSSEPEFGFKPKIAKKTPMSQKITKISSNQKTMFSSSSSNK